MGKNKKKPLKSHLSTEEKKLGKSHLFLLLGIIIVGGVIGVYFLNMQS
jgi:hypothetical protein